MKKKFHIILDEKLYELLDQHCKCEGIYRSHFIVNLIAKELNVTLNSDGTINANDYIDYKLKELDNCIEKMQEKKRELEKLKVI